MKEYKSIPAFLEALLVGTALYCGYKGMQYIGRIISIHGNTQQMEKQIAQEDKNMTDPMNMPNETLREQQQRLYDTQKPHREMLKNLDWIVNKK